MPCRSGDEPLPELSEEDLKRLEAEKKVKEEGAETLKNYSELEKEAFTGFMAVMLCKAMEIINRYNLMQFTYHEMEWWYKEHKFRDEHNNKGSGEKVEEMLQRIKNKFKVE